MHTRSVCVYIYIYTHMYAYRYICVCIYIYIYICIMYLYKLHIVGNHMAVVLRPACLLRVSTSEGLTQADS